MPLAAGGTPTTVYVDGFNLYYGCLKDHPNRKWLNLYDFAVRSLPKAVDVQRVHYFTATVKAMGADRGKPLRQQVLLRAMATIPQIEVHLGKFLEHKVRLPAADGSGFVEVLKPEEKHTDVNLATQMVLDAAKDRFELAVVVSDDSDLQAPIVVVRAEFGKRVLVLSPRGESRVLRACASKFIIVQPRLLRGCQFPDQMQDSGGIFNRPVAWGGAAPAPVPVAPS